MRIGRAIVVALATIVVASLAAGAAASHFHRSGWRDRHNHYPALPSGYNAIVAVFGQPCNERSNDNLTYWVARDDGHAYPLYYHYSLGGYGKYYGGTGSKKRSSNLNNDVRGHIRNEHLVHYVTHGIYGYVCRRIAGSSKWSTHAWGIAVDINTAANPYPTSSCNGMPGGLTRAWTKHRWIHGRAFSDCMHFQYATDY